MPCIIFSTLWKKTYTVCLRTWFELDQIICITVKYEVGILLIFSWCCFFFFFQSMSSPNVCWKFWDPIPQERKASCDRALLTSESRLWEAIPRTRIWLPAESQQLHEQLQRRAPRGRPGVRVVLFTWWKSAGRFKITTKSNYRPLRRETVFKKDREYLKTN